MERTSLLRSYLLVNSLMKILSLYLRGGLALPPSRDLAIAGISVRHARERAGTHQIRLTRSIYRVRKTVNFIAGER